MRVLVLGATGFGGGHLAPALLEAGYEVWGTGRPHGEDESVGLLEVEGRALPMVPCDVTEPESVAAALATSRPDAVMHLAGMAFAPAAARDPAAAFRVNAMGVVHVLEEVLRYRDGTRVVVVSSGEVYGAIEPGDLPVTEETPLRPNSIYAASKASGDLAARAFARSRGADVVRVRPFNHTGPGQQAEFVCPDFAGQIASIAQGHRAPVLEVGNLEPRRDFTDVRDIARGYVAALQKGRAGEAYNLCRGEAIAISAIVDDLSRLAGIDPEVRTVAGRRRRAEIPAFWGSADKARADLGWEPRIPWQRTLADLLGAAGFQPNRG